MRTLLTALLVVSILPTIETIASAHGGSYRGPAGEVPPGQRDPRDPQPPPENPGGITPPHDGGQGTPPERPAPPDSGRDGNGSGGSPRAQPPGNSSPPGGLPGGSGTRTPRGAGHPRPPVTFDSWLFWWHHNKDEFLNLKSAVRRRQGTASPNSSRAFGGDYAGNRDRVEAPTDREVRKSVVPALMKVIGDESMHPDIRGGALIALARCGSSAESARIFFAAAGRKEALVRESAILALGIMQRHDREVSEFLISYLEDTDHPFRSRCFAALSLGLLEDDSDAAFSALERCLTRGEANLDVPVCAIEAIGLIGDEKRVATLTDWLDKGRVGPTRLSDLLRSHLVSALGKIGDVDALPAIRSTIAKKDLLTRRSAVIALGQILPAAPEKTQLEYVTKLSRHLDRDADRTTRNFWLISLGRIAGHPGASSRVRDLVVHVLTKAFEEGRRSTERPFAALALGIVCFEPSEHRAKPEELRYRIGSLIREDLARLRGDKAALGAQAVALGLIGDRDEKTVDLLVRILQDTGEERKLRGAAAVGLGLIGEKTATDAILRALRERQDRALRVDTAVGAGLLGDKKAVAVLVETLNDKKASQFELGSVALALGQIGDHRAIEPLLGILEPGREKGAYPDLTRALVAVALGQIADRRDLRVLFRLSKDVNYRAMVGALEEALTIL